MRTQQQFLDEYAVSHRNPTNLLIHYICVPILFVTGLGLLWLIPIGGWLGFSDGAAYWVNGATVFAVLTMLFYLKLSLATALIMSLWFALNVAVIVAVDKAGWPLLWICC